MTVKMLLAEKPTIYLTPNGGTTAVPTYGIGPPGAAGATGATGPPGSSGGPVPGGTATDGFLVVKDTATAGLARYQDPATSALLLAKYMVRGEIVKNVKDYGAVGDGVTNDQPAIAAAVAAAGTNGTVIFPAGNYAVATSLTLGSVRLEGKGKGACTIKKTGSSVGNFITFSAGAAAPELLGIDVDLNSLVTSIGINFAAGATTDPYFEQVNIHGMSPTASTIGIRIRDGITGLRGRYVTIDGIFQGIYIDGTVEDLTWDEFHIRNWQERGIYVVGTATTATTDVTLKNGRITDVAAGGSVVQPLVFEGDDALLHKRPWIDKIRAIGPNRSHNNATPGTADNISLHRCQDFKISDSHSMYGGDLGYAVNFCERGTLENLHALFNDTAGLCLGWTQVSPQAYADDISVIGGVYMNNGQNRNADRLDVGRCGIRGVQATDVVIVGPVLGDDQGTKTQKYGYSFTDCTDIYYGPDRDSGNALGMVNLDTGNTRVQSSVAAVGSPSFPYEMTTATSIANSTTDTVLMTAPTVAVGDLVAGKTCMRLRISGDLDGIATSGIFTGRVKANGTTLVSITLAASQTGAVTASTWTVDVDVFVETLGSSGVVSCTGTAVGVLTSAAAAIGVRAAQGVAVTVNLTAGLTLTFTGVMATANAGNIIRAKRAVVQKIA